MKKLLIVAALAANVVGYADLNSGNIVGYQTTVLPVGKSKFTVPFRSVGSNEKWRIGSILNVANIGDSVELKGGTAKVGLSDNGKHWYLDGSVIDDMEFDDGVSFSYLNCGNKPIQVTFAGSVSERRIDNLPPSTQNPAKNDNPRPVLEVRNNRPMMSMADLLSYSTVQLISTVAPNKFRTGTGFFFEFISGQYGIPVIISNRHVIDGVKKTQLLFTVAKDGRPTGETISYYPDYNRIKWIPHPDPTVDLAALPILPFLNYARDVHHVELFIAPFSSVQIPDEENFKGLNQLDDVIMIGYPDSLRDRVNNQPIFRKGSLATDPNKNFDGERVFLVDMPVYGGSSGSPILLANEGPHIDRVKHSFSTGNRLMLLGVNVATCIHSATGSVNVVVQPTAKVDLVTKTPIPNNLGVIIHASRIKELEQYVTNLIVNKPGK